MTSGRSRAFTLLGLHLLIGVYSLADVASKAASGMSWFSLSWIIAYGLMLVFLGVYAIGWQQVIKRMPLSSAYANRAVSIIWGIFWGVMIFGESLTVGKVVGAAIIMAGIVLFERADHREHQDEEA